MVAHICNPSTLEGIYMMCSKKTDASKTQMNNYYYFISQISRHFRWSYAVKSLFLWNSHSV